MRVRSSSLSPARESGVPPSSARERPLERADLGRDLLVAALRRPPLLVEALLDAREVGHHQLELERFEITGRVGGDPAVVERPQHHEDRVGVAQRAERLGAQPLTRLHARRQRDVHELEAGPHDFLRRRHLRQRVEALVGNGRNPDGGFVLARGRKAGQRAEKPVRTRTREADEAEVLHRGAGYR